MPELPEVETISRQLDRVLVGKKIKSVKVLKEKSFLGRSSDIVGKTVGGVDRRAKMLVVSFEQGDRILVIHLKMTGQLIYLSGNHRVVGGHPTPDWVNDLPSKHTRVIIEFTDDSKLFFNDLRVFGWMKLMSSSDYSKLVIGLPPDVNTKEFTLDLFSKAIKRSGRAIKVALLDQTKFGGVGNIYANDALYLAKISPVRKGNDLSDVEIDDLYKAVKIVIEKGIKYGGASVDKYVDAAGVGGKYQEHFLVYNREGARCRRDGKVIVKSKLGGRGTYYCPGCQK